MTDQTITQACPGCDADVTMEPYDAGSGAEMACPHCELCWGAHGQPLRGLRDFHPDLEAMQSRCPNCDAEQYVMNILPFSIGSTPCHRCGKHSKSMTYREWTLSLAALRSRS